MVERNYCDPLNLGSSLIGDTYSLRAIYSSRQLLLDKVMKTICTLIKIVFK